MSIGFQTQGGKIVRTFQRPGRELCKAFLEAPTSILSDVLDRMNVFRSELKPMIPGRRFSGPAFTVEEIEGGNLMSHLALKYVEAGDVLVIDAKGVISRAAWGGLQTFAASRKGVAAILLDGAVRDAGDIHKYGVPVCCRGVSPAGPHKGWGGRINVPISCAGLAIRPGDIIVGDDDGIVAVPFDSAETTLQKARQKMQVEEEWFRQVELGHDTADFLGFEALAQKYGIEIV